MGVITCNGRANPIYGLQNAPNIPQKSKNQLGNGQKQCWIVFIICICLLFQLNLIIITMENESLFTAYFRAFYFFPILLCKAIPPPLFAIVNVRKRNNSKSTTQTKFTNKIIHRKGFHCYIMNQLFKKKG